MRKVFYPTEGIGRIIGRFKNELREKITAESALTGNTELCGKVASDVPDDGELSL